MASFGSLTCLEGGSVWFPHWGGEAVQTYKRIAGGALAQQYPAGAPKNDKMSFPIRLDVTTDDLQDWLDARGTTATFTWTDGARSATLDAITDIRISRDSAVILAVLELTGR
jgi:phage-related protein